jgi:hypothetical protein
MSKANAQRTINVIKRTIEKNTGNAANYRYLPAKVVDSGSQFISAYVAGETEYASEDIRVPAGAYVSSGDYIIVGFSGEGKSWISEILPTDDYSKLIIDPNAAQIKIGDGTYEPYAGDAGQVIFSNGPYGSAYWADNFANEIRISAINRSGSTFAKGTVVYISSVSGQIPEISKASASSEATSSKTIGIVSENIAHNAQGLVTTFGVIKNVNTNGMTEGANVWLSTTAGEYTTTKPSVPNHGVHVGYVLKASATAGRIFVYIQNGFELEELHNVKLGTLSDGQALIYSASSNYWTNGAAVSGVSFNDTAYPATESFSSSGAYGASSYAARQDHLHPMPANPVSYGSVTAQTSFGSSYGDGAATTLSRSDHTHGTPTNPVPAHEASSDPHPGYLQESVVSGFASPTISLSDTASSGSGTTAIRSSATIAAFNAVNPSTASFGDSAYYGSSNYAARADHTHGMPSNPVSYGSVSTQTSFGSSYSNGVATTLSRSDHTHGTPTNPVPAHEAAGDPHPGYLQESVISAIGVPAITLSTTNSAGSGTTVIGTGATIAAFTSTSPSALSSSASTGSSGYASRIDHVHPNTGLQLTSEKYQANGYAGLNSSTLVPTAYLGTGTASSANYLRGDSTWASIPSASTMGTKLVLTTAQSIPDITDTAISFGAATSSEYWDTDGWHETSTYPTRITPTSAGKMLVTAQVSFAAGSLQRWGYLVVNGNPSTGEVIARTTIQAASNSAQTYFTLSGWYNFNGTTDYVELYVRQNNGGALNVLAQASSNAGTSLAVHSVQGATGATGPEGGTTLVTSSSATNSSVADAATSQTILASNASRKGFSIYNDSSQAAYVKFGSTASTTDFTMKLSPYGFYEMFGDCLYTGIITAIWASDSSGSARVAEW